jgi:hypothetical protein
MVFCNTVTLTVDTYMVLESLQLSNNSLIAFSERGMVPGKTNLFNTKQNEEKLSLLLLFLITLLLLLLLSLPLFLLSLLLSLLLLLDLCKYG